MAILNNSNAISSGGYDINNSLRFRASASASLSRTPSATNQKTWTWSGWVKRGAIEDGGIFGAGASGTNYFNIRFQSEVISVVSENPSLAIELRTTPVYRDPSAWYHIVLAVDTTQATAANRAKLYVNGVQVTAFTTAVYPTLNLDMVVNSAVVHYNGRIANSAIYFDGYLTEINFIDGQALTPSSFGETDTTTGSWKPKAYTGTYGTNGFYLKFSDIATTSGSNAGLGKDFSGNANYWTTNNISVTAGVTYDAMIDSPTLTSATVANYAVLNPLWKASTGTLSSANLNYTDSDSLQKYVRSTIGVTSGKWYFEGVFTNTTSAMFIGMSADTETSTSGNAYIGNSANGWSMQVSTTVNKVNNGNFTSISSTNYINTSNVFQVAYDADNGKLFFGVNNTWFGSADPVAGTNAQFTSVSGTLYASIGTQGNGAVAINFGQRPFTYTPPTGFVALNTYNLPDSTIKKGSSYMDATTYTGTGATQVVTNSGSMKPDLVWLKSRSNARDHRLMDTVRGINLGLQSNLTSAEYTGTALSSINSNGFTLNTTDNQNVSAEPYIGWQWQAGQGTNTSNTSGTITSTVSVNTTAGFSVVTYTGTGANATVGHGLGVAPSMMIIKQRNSTQSWSVYHASLGATKRLYLDLTDAVETTTTAWNSTAPTSSVYSVGTSAATNGNGNTFVAYCWAEIAGFSKFASYTGNGSTDGPFIFLGFRPKFVMIKRTDSTNDWNMYDSRIGAYNVIDELLKANTSAAETTYYTYGIDFLSNGFKLRETDTGQNASGGTYIVAAFAENPFKNANAR
jgi:hypothetical protein